MQVQGGPSPSPTPSVVMIPSVTLTFDSLDVGSMQRADMVFGVGNSPSPVANFTSQNPPGNGSPPFKVGPCAYLQWSGRTLYLTQDCGRSPWSAVAVLPSGLNPYNAIKVVKGQWAGGGWGTSLYEMVDDGQGDQGIAYLEVLAVPAPGTPPQTFQVITLGGKNSAGALTGLVGIWGTCFGQGAWYCAPVFAAAANGDGPLHNQLYAVDSSNKTVVDSRDSGHTWAPDNTLTSLVQSRAGSMTDSIGSSEVHVIAFDPASASHILVGTDQAGIFASADGGQSWSAIPNSSQATAISSFYLDDISPTLTQAYIGTYGRGLWRLSLDWSTLVPAVISVQRHPIAPKSVLQARRDVKVVNGPTVQSTTPTTALIMWSTNIAADTLIRYGARPDQLDHVASSPWGGLTHRVKLENLGPETLYYRVVTSNKQTTQPMNAIASFTPGQALPQPANTH